MCFNGQRKVNEMSSPLICQRCGYVINSAPVTVGMPDGRQLYYHQSCYSQLRPQTGLQRLANLWVPILTISYVLMLMNLFNMFRLFGDMFTLMLFVVTLASLLVGVVSLVVLIAKFALRRKR